MNVFYTDVCDTILGSNLCNNVCYTDLCDMIILGSALITSDYRDVYFAIFLALPNISYYIPL